MSALLWRALPCATRVCNRHPDRPTPDTLRAGGAGRAGAQAEHVVMMDEQPLRDVQAARSARHAAGCARRRARPV
eukprot:3019254-Prymnesium_polylepis.1